MDCEREDPPETESSRILRFSTHEEFEYYLDEINNRLEFFFQHLIIHIYLYFFTLYNLQWMNYN